METIAVFILKTSLTGDELIVYVSHTELNSSSINRDELKNERINSKLYIRNFINISSSYNLLDVIYTEISSTMKSIHSFDWKNFLSNFDKIHVLSASVRN